MKWIYLILVLILVPLVSAIPEIPHQFYGYVSDSNGLLASGTVTARLCNRDFNIQIVNSYYGLSEPFLISKEDCSSINTEFFVNGYKIRDYSYISGGYTQLNLVVPTTSVQNNPLVINNPQDTTTNEDNNDGGRERESRMGPPPEDLVLDNNEKTADENPIQHLQIIKSMSITGKAVYGFFTETKTGVATASAGITVIVLGLIYLLRVFLI